MFASAYKKIFSLILCFSSSSAMVGCGSSGSKELEKVLTHKANFTYINALDYMSDFYVQKRLITTGSSGLFDDRHLAIANVEARTVSSQYDYDFPIATNMVNFGSLNSNSQENKIKSDTTLSDDEQLWVVAWQDDDGSHLSHLNKFSSDKNDVFSVRLFANGEYDIDISGNRIAATKKGIATDYFTFSECNDGLSVNGHVVDMCQFDLGKSYLVVVDGNGHKVVAQEVA